MGDSLDSIIKRNLERIEVLKKINKKYPDATSEYLGDRTIWRSPSLQPEQCNAVALTYTDGMSKPMPILTLCLDEDDYRIFPWAGKTILCTDVSEMGKTNPELLEQLVDYLKKHGSGI